MLLLNHESEWPKLPSGEIEAGTAKITRYQDGRPTRFTFKKPFQKAPHVQFTPDFGDNPAAGFKQSWLYFLGQGKPAVDKEGFTVGCFTDVGHELTFRYTAIEIRTIRDNILLGIDPRTRSDSQVHAAKGRAMIAVAHRLATLNNADITFILGEGGQLLDKGSHLELLRKGEVYYQMFMHLEDET
ncbi:hypothetical protein APSETT445_006220 [Aspergillus pseudonomiae]